uniref:DUF834 domain-containing protein n=1 Tax=Oryza glumipatula TaxID=40148 RepID=A0A0E0BL10_9ORYZ
MEPELRDGAAAADGDGAGAAATDGGGCGWSPSGGGGWLRRMWTEPECLRRMGMEPELKDGAAAVDWDGAQAAVADGSDGWGRSPSGGGGCRQRMGEGGLGRALHHLGHKPRSAAAVLTVPEPNLHARSGRGRAVVEPDGAAEVVVTDLAEHRGAAAELRDGAAVTDWDGARAAVADGGNGWGWSSSGGGGWGRSPWGVADAGNGWGRMGEKDEKKGF